MSNYGDEQGYNDSNRAFLQAFMARSTMTFEEAKPVLAGIFSVLEKKEVLPEDVTEADLNSYISGANTTVSPFDLEIRSCLHQTTQTRIYALVNTTSDPLTQLATTYSADEIAFVKRLLDAMFETYNTWRQEAMVVSSMQAIQLAKPSANRESLNRRESEAGGATQGSSGQGLTMKEAEGMLGRLIEEGWLEKSRKGFYSLSARALMELRAWLVSTYNDVDDDEEEEAGGRGRNDKVKMCFACKEIVTVGQRCPQRQCPGRLHDICIRNFFRMQREEKCPVCKADWTGDNFVGEKAITTTDRYMSGRRRSGGTQRRAAEQEEDEDDEPMNEG